MCQLVVWVEVFRETEVYEHEGGVAVLFFEEEVL
jgi:hypothetical protein